MASVGGQAQALPLGILEIQRGAAVHLADRGRLDASLAQARGPVVKACRVDPEPGAADRPRAAPFAARGPVEEGKVGPGAARAIGVEQVIGRGVVLIDGLLDAPHPHDLAIEAVGAAGVGRDGGQVVDTGKVHGGFPFC